MQNCIKQAFNQNSKFELTGHTYTVSSTEPQFNLVHARRDETGERFEFDYSHLVREFFKKNLVFKYVSAANDEPKGLDLEESTYLMLSPEERALVDYRYGYVEARQQCLDAGMRSHKSIEIAIANHALATGDENPPSPVTTWRWTNKLVAARGARAALRRAPKRPSKKTSQRKFEVVRLAEEALEWVIKKSYLQKEKISVARLHTELKVLIATDPKFKEAKVYSLSTLYRRVAELPEYQKMLYRDGYYKARREFPSGRDVHEPTYFSEIVELDHTQFDMVVVDEKTRMIELGRPWLTKILCRASRLVLGFYITLDSPSFKSVMHAVRHAIMPKDYLKERYPNIQNEWPCMGLFQTLVVDNGQDLHGKDVQVNLSDICEVIYLKKGCPNDKGRVERSFGTDNRTVMDELPGRTDSNHHKNGDYKSAKEAVMTLPELIERFTMWLVDVYHIGEHTALGIAPLAYWKGNPDKQLGLMLPPSCDALDQLLWKQPKNKPKLQKYGLELNSMKYQSPALMKIAKQHGFKLPMDVFFDEDDISWIKVRHPDTQELLTVPCKAKAFREKGVSLKELKEIRKEAKRLGQMKNESYNEMFSDTALTAAYARLKKQKDRAIETTKKARRKAAKKQTKSSPQVSGTDKKTIRETAESVTVTPISQDNVINIENIKPAEEN